MNMTGDKMRQVVVTSLGTDFKRVTELRTVDKPGPPQGNDVLVKTRYVGINASDVNFSAGKYDPTRKPPFPAGLEGMGVVEAVGDSVEEVKINDIVVYVHPGSYSEYTIVPSEKVVVVPNATEAKPEYLSLVLSGLTASISLSEEAGLDPGENLKANEKKKVLVTAAAGGTGQFAVQLAKLAGCEVIGTCSSDDKADFLKKTLGCHHVINYKKDNLDEVLSSDKFKDQLDVVYESVGQDFFNAALKNLRVKGRLVVIGMISMYQQGQDVADGASYPNIPMVCLRKSASVRGFFLLHYTKQFETHTQRLINLYNAGKLQVEVDEYNQHVKNHGVTGMDLIRDAVDFLFSGQSKGKLVVKISD